MKESIREEVSNELKEELMNRLLHPDILGTTNDETRRAFIREELEVILQKHNTPFEVKCDEENNPPDFN